MSANQVDPKSEAEEQSTPVASLEPPQPGQCGQQGAVRPLGEGRVDVTGIVPEDVHVDPNITEGHPGYEESGTSEIIPPQGQTQEESSQP